MKEGRKKYKIRNIKLKINIIYIDIKYSVLDL